LNYFLPPSRKGIEFEHRFRGRASVKDLIEALGVPHVEVDLILIGGESVDFSHVVRDGDRISVYPTFKAIDISGVTRVRPEPLDQIRFVLDNHLGKLANHLRMVGFDVLYEKDYTDAELARLSQNERRILLTKDRGLLKRSAVSHGYCVREVDPRRQLIEVIERFDLIESIEPFQRCIRCNGLLEPIPKDAIIERLPPETKKHYDAFHICRDCGRVYWEGPHYQQMEQFVEELIESLRV
jgi:uncharacterized protein with PIN domain